MVINKDNYQISQRTGETAILIYKDGEFFKALTGKTGLKYNELLKILEAYRKD